MSPLAHAFAHAPQFAASFVVSTHAAPHEIAGATQPPSGTGSDASEVGVVDEGGGRRTPDVAASGASTVFDEVVSTPSLAPVAHAIDDAITADRTYCTTRPPRPDPRAAMKLAVSTYS